MRVKRARVSSIGSGGTRKGETRIQCLVQFSAVYSFASMLDIESASYNDYISSNLGTGTPDTACTGIAPPPAAPAPVCSKPIAVESEASPPAPPAQPIHPTPDNKQNGLVVKILPDGKQYRGEMIDGKRHGQGSSISPDGASYVGNWQNDRRNGYGESKYKDGSWYKGNWVMGNRQGEGLCTYADGNMFQGSWVANLPR